MNWYYTHVVHNFLGLSFVRFVSYHCCFHTFINLNVYSTKGTKGSCKSMDEVSSLGGRSGAVHIVCQYLFMCVWRVILPHSKASTSNHSSYFKYLTSDISSCHGTGHFFNITRRVCIIFNPSHHERAECILLIWLNQPSWLSYISEIQSFCIHPLS